MIILLIIVIIIDYGQQILCKIMRWIKKIKKYRVIEIFRMILKIQKFNKNFSL